MIRGDIYQANLDPTEGSEQAGKRPVAIVSRNGINRSSPILVVVPLTAECGHSQALPLQGRERVTKFAANKKIYPSHHLVKASNENGLDLDSIAKCEQIRAIAKSRLLNKLGSLNTQDLLKIDAALKIVLSLK
ncbi:MAG: type II toxin-antitoxin system PemK/MazF family toxin [Cyanobacteria bacterium P01_G01_bin.39]